MSPGVSGWDGRFWFYYDKIYLVLPNGSVIFLWSPSLTVFGGQFSIVTLYTLLTTTDCHSVPHEKHVSPPTPPPPSVGDKFWPTTYKLRSHRRNLVEVGHRTECNPEALSAILRFPFLLAPVSWKKEFSLSRSSKGSELNVSGGATDLSTMQLNVIRSTFTVAKKKGIKSTGPRNTFTCLRTVDNLSFLVDLIVFNLWQSS